MRREPYREGSYPHKTGSCLHFILTATILGVVAVLIVVLVFSGATGLRPVENVSASPAGQPPASNEPQSEPSLPLQVLIVHDQADDPQLSQGLAAVLGHFPVQSDVLRQEYYEAGTLEGYDSVFYIGGTHKPVNQAFLEDVNASRKPVVWMGRGLQWMGAERSLSRFGLYEVRVDGTGLLETVEYQDRVLKKYNSVSVITSLAGNSGAQVLAWAASADGERLPYAVRSGNFWFFAEVPMAGIADATGYSTSGVGGDSSYLVLADLLHDILGQQHGTRHPALLRLEDIHPKTDLGRLNEVVDYLYHNGIPFGLSLVPVYVNPGTGEEIHLADRPEFVRAIKEAQSKGAVIVLHGYTHQRTGETVVDYEFWDGETHAPPADETEAATRDRLDAALRETSAQGIYPSIWETPHYASSEASNQVFASQFGVAWERRDAPFFPYPVRLQTTSQLVLPETLGYVNPEEGNDAARMLSFSEAQLVVRDGYAAAFFHPAADQKQLRKLVEGLREQGYSFISPARAAGLAYPPAKPPSRLSHISWSLQDRISGFIGDTALDTRIVTAVAFFVIFYYWGVFLLSRKPQKVRGQPDPDLSFVIVIPCLNEERVIGKTLKRLLSMPQKNLRVLVVNDDSDDRTREIVLSIQDERLILIDHPPGQARTGKGRVLNHAFKYLLASDLVREKGTSKVVMGVLDADGRVEPNVLEAVNPYFSDQGAGAVQVGVRISNSEVNTLTRWQNFEFLTFARISQKAREYLGSVGLGGNGQFVRLKALKSLGDDPWSDCLTEDLDLGIRLLLEGWRNHYCPDTFVSQQGISNFQPLVRQRTRWFQGHITCWRHIPGLMARKAPLLARTDTIYYLLSPMLVFLFMPGSIMFIFWSIYFLVTGGSAMLQDPLAYLPAVLVWYLFSFGALPTVVWTFWREEKEMNAGRAFLWAHLFAFFYVIWFIAGIKAVYRMARGQDAWMKTARTEEPEEA